MVIAEPITPAQLGVLKNRVVWMGNGQPTGAYVKWWDKQDTKKMEAAIEKLTKEEAFPLVEAAIMGDYSLIIRKMNKLLKGGESKVL